MVCVADCSIVVQSGVHGDKRRERTQRDPCCGHTAGHGDVSDGARCRRGYDSLPRSCAGQYHCRRNQQPSVTLSVLGSSRIFSLEKNTQFVKF